MSEVDGRALLRYQGARARCSCTSAASWPAVAYQVMASVWQASWNGTGAADRARGAVAGLAGAGFLFRVLDRDLNCPAGGVALDDLRRGSVQVSGGDAWTFTALDPDTKLVPSWFVGGRTADDAWELLTDLRGRLASRVQLSTDGHKMYLTAVPETLGDDVDYAQVVKHYGRKPADPENHRYSPAPCVTVTINKVSGTPDPAHISTSLVERQNLTIRMSMRGFTRLTNGFSKKLENLTAAVRLHFMYYNFARPHTTLTKAANHVPTTPAMAAGVADHVWAMTEIAALLDQPWHSVGDSN
jgi:IS1 family transposase